MLNKETGENISPEDGVCVRDAEADVREKAKVDERARVNTREHGLEVRDLIPRLSFARLL